MPKPFDRPSMLCSGSAGTRGGGTPAAPAALPSTLLRCAATAAAAAASISAAVATSASCLPSEAGAGPPLLAGGSATVVAATSPSPALPSLCGRKPLAAASTKSPSHRRATKSESYSEGSVGASAAALASVGTALEAGETPGAADCVGPSAPPASMATVREPAGSSGDGMADGDCGPRRRAGTSYLGAGSGVGEEGAAGTSSSCDFPASWPSPLPGPRALALAPALSALVVTRAAASSAGDSKIRRTGGGPAGKNTCTSGVADGSPRCRRAFSRSRRI